MAKTTPTNVDSSIREIWANKVLREHLVSGFWGRFVGSEGSGAAIIQRTDLLNKPGDTIHVQVTAPLTGAGVSGDTTALEGSEENLTTSSFKLVPEFYRHAVRVYRRANKKSLIDLRSEAQMRLAEWGGEKMDDLRFASFVQTANLNGATYTPNTYLVEAATGGGSGVDKIEAGDAITVKDLQKIKLKLTNNKAKPLKTAEGQPVYGIVLHPNCLFGLKRESEYRDWVKDAQVRGDTNPFFVGATAMIDGMVVYEHPNVPVANNAGSIQYAKNIAFGAEAFVEAVDENPSWDEDSFDYGNEFGIAYSFACQSRRALELSAMLVYAEAVNL